MKRRLQFFAAILGLLVVFSTVLSAQRALPPGFDSKSQSDVDGVVTMFQWTNPLSFVGVKVNDGKGPSVIYLCALPGSSMLEHLGLKRDAFKEGKRVRVEDYLAKDGSNHAYARLITSPDGETVFDGSAISYAAGGRGLISATSRKQTQ
jgi:Family of unknown function (DUF6152)